MTDATRRLCELLDERGVEHYDGTERTLWLKDEQGYRASADELTSGRISLHLWCTTPEQAIDATLGRGECKNTGECRWFHCSKCGFGFGDIYINEESKYDAEHQPNFCPNCGRRCVG